ncbi:methyltransferase [Rhizobium sp. Leaf384]|uniref:class I SAM-dependent methyltransferase n=1 Tax=unclassified Rhizobium TaxID=2613769 RepID=UPI0007126424|nr:MULTISPECIES: class I SAM-dependent methyltransferase [unclassified Rhizobium]KQR72976.1 methyltransferase [Rhizobium sp. Leaf341]KQS75616.1 methyltransferase [Rhizobium sp. Leaf384]KQS75865.1 methyltransferase [Rhizobium sp. Leaf383]
MKKPIDAFDGQSLITPLAANRQVFPSGAAVSDRLLRIARDEMTLILQVAAQQIQMDRSPAQIIARLIRSLHESREKYLAVWPQLIAMVQDHPVAAYFHNDPFTRWSFEKPRGYSGDASLIDFIYGHPDIATDVEAASPLGRTLYDYTRNAPSAVAVRERRDLLTRTVDETAASRGPETEVLAVAAGHLREAEASVAMRERRLKRWVALDQDPLSVGRTMRNFQGTPVDAMDGSVRGLLKNDYSLGQFDLIYAAGLYDYLADKVAVKLTQTCLSMLKPGGTFLFANFSTEVPDDGYMETMMNWTLLLRSQSEMWSIIDASLDGKRAEKRVFFGANRNIIYGTIHMPH